MSIQDRPTPTDSPTGSSEPVDADRVAAPNGGGHGRSPAHRRRGARSGWIGRVGGVPVVAGMAVVLLAVPMLFLIIPLLTYHGVFSNWGDNAATELSVQNAVGLHQTVGPYDRFGWYHPGPMYFYLLAIPYAAMSWSGAALPVGATLINLAAVIGIVVLVARRLGSTAAVAAAALVCGFEVLMQPFYLTNAWGPIIILLPTAFFLVLCADLAAGGVWSVVGAGVVGTFVVQTNVSSAPAVGIALILALLVRVVVWRRARVLGESLRAHWLPGVVAVVATGLLWVPPVWQQLTHHPGNLGQLINFFLHNRGDHSAGQAWSALANGIFQRNMTSNFDVLVGSVHHYDVYLAVWFVAMAAVTALCWRRQQWFAMGLAAGMIPVAGVIFLSLMRVVGPLYGYLVLWCGALAVCSGLAVVLCLFGPGGVFSPGELFTSRRAVLASGNGAQSAQPWRSGVDLGVRVALVGCLLLASGRLADLAFDYGASGTYPNVTAASAAVERALPSKAHRLLVCVTSTAAWPTSAGVVANLRKDGYDARVTAPWLHIFGQQLAASGQETEAIFLVSNTQKPPALTVAPVRRTAGGDLDIGVYSPGSGYVSASVCPPVT